jgi:hypothetical protein
VSKPSIKLLCLAFLAILFCAIVSRYVHYRHSLSGLYLSSGNLAASVWLNNRLIGSTPFLSEKLAAGKHILRLAPENTFYLPLETTVNLTSGFLTVINWNYSDETGQGYGLVYEMSEASHSAVTIKSQPDRALIYLDDAPQPLFAPQTLTNLTPGEHRFTLVLPGYQNLSGEITLGEKQQITVNATLIAEIDPSTSLHQNENEVDNTTETTAATDKSVLILPTDYFENNKEVLRVRSKPDAASEQLGFVAVGDTLDYLGEENNGFRKVLFENQTGWVSSGFTEIK